MYELRRWMSRVPPASMVAAVVGVALGLFLFFGPAFLVGRHSLSPAYLLVWAGAWAPAWIAPPPWPRWERNSHWITTRITNFLCVTLFIGAFLAPAYVIGRYVLPA